MGDMGLRATRSRRRRLAIALLAASAVATVASAPPVAAETPAPPVPKMKLDFPAKTFRLAGPGALVYVQCVGPAAGSCIGTLALKAPFGTHEVAYALERGQKQMLVVPLGSEDELFDRIETAQAVAHTMQASGSSVRTARVLRAR
jgi:hypothetical protein